MTNKCNAPKSAKHNILTDTGAVILKTELSKCTHKQDPESQPDPEPAHFSRNLFNTWLGPGAEPVFNTWLGGGLGASQNPGGSGSGAAGAGTFCREPEPEPFQHFAWS